MNKQNKSTEKTSQRRAIQETIYLLSIPGMRRIIRKGLKTPIKECTKNLKGFKPV